MPMAGDSLKKGAPRGRRFKKRVLTALSLDRSGDAAQALGALSPKPVINALFRHLHAMDPLVRWRAVTAMGWTVDRLVLADEYGTRGEGIPAQEDAYTVFDLAPRNPRDKRITIGCSSTCDVQINDESVSTLHATLENIIGSGIPGRSLTIENIPDYPLELALPLIDALGLKVCLDIGHLLISGASLAAAFEMFNDRITLMHIHGAADDRDHRSLDQLPQKWRDVLFNALKKFTGVVSLEVFSKKHLLASLECLRKEWG